MSKIPTLIEIVQSVESLGLAKRRKALQGRKPFYSDSYIVALAVYQKLAGFKYSQKMLAVLSSLTIAVPAPSTFAERKAGLVMQIIAAVKQLCSAQHAVKQHLDSKKLEVIDFARANRTQLAGAYGYDHIHKRIFYGFRLHARADDGGQLCRIILRPANEHDVGVAPRLLEDLNYTVVTADKGYISQALKADLDKRAVHLVTPRRSNQLPPPKAEQTLYQGHRIIETVFSSLDRLGLSDKPYRSNLGLVLHVYTTLLAYQLKHHLAFLSPVPFPNWGDLLLLSPFEAALPSRLGYTRHWSVSFAPKAVAESERAGVYFYWLCNPLFFAFVATRGKSLQVPASERPAWSATLNRLELEAQEHLSGSKQATKALLTLLLVDAARLASVVAGETLDVSPLLARVFDVVEARFRETLSLSDVADALHLTPAHLTTLVRQTTGRTVNAWITERRMVEARRLLLQTNHYIADVAAASGYPDPAYFTRQFKGRHGVSPLRYRQTHKAL